MNERKDLEKFEFIGHCLAILYDRRALLVKLHCPECGERKISNMFHLPPLSREVIDKYRIVKEKYGGRKCSSCNVRLDARYTSLRIATRTRLIKDVEKSSCRRRSEIRGGIAFNLYRAI